MFVVQALQGYLLMAYKTFETKIHSGIGIGSGVGFFSIFAGRGRPSPKTQTTKSPASVITGSPLSSNVPTLMDGSFSFSWRQRPVH